MVCLRGLSLWCALKRTPISWVHRLYSFVYGLCTQLLGHLRADQAAEGARTAPLLQHWPRVRGQCCPPNCRVRKDSHPEHFDSIHAALCHRSVALTRICSPHLPHMKLVACTWHLRLELQEYTYLLTYLLNFKQKRHDEKTYARACHCITNTGGCHPTS